MDSIKLEYDSQAFSVEAAQKAAQEAAQKTMEETPVERKLPN